MALNTALTFLVVSIGLLWSQPRLGVMAVITSARIGGWMAGSGSPSSSECRSRWV